MCCGVELACLGSGRLGRRKDFVLCRPLERLLVSRARDVPLLALQAARSRLVTFELCFLSTRVEVGMAGGETVPS